MARRLYPRNHVGYRDRMRDLYIRSNAEARARQIGAELAPLGYRLDTDPNGYVVAGHGRIVMRGPNLAAVEAWLAERADLLSIEGRSHSRSAD